MRLPIFLMILFSVAIFSCEEDSVQPGPEGQYEGSTDQGEIVSFKLESIGGETVITRYSITILYDVGGGNTETEVISDSDPDGLATLEDKEFTIYQDGNQSYPIQGFQESGSLLSGTYILKALLMQDNQPEVVSGTFRVNKVDAE